MCSQPKSPSTLVENGNYDVRLHFAELFSGAQASGVRVFDVKMEDEIVLSSLDIFDEAGDGYTALVKQISTTVNDEALTIELMRKPGLENPLLCGVEIHDSGVPYVAPIVVSTSPSVLPSSRPSFAQSDVPSIGPSTIPSEVPSSDPSSEPSQTVEEITTSTTGTEALTTTADPLTTTATATEALTTTVTEAFTTTTDPLTTTSMIIDVGTTSTTPECRSNESFHFRQSIIVSVTRRRRWRSEQL